MRAVKKEWLLGMLCVLSGVMPVSYTHLTDPHARERNVPDVCNISDIHAVDNAVEYIDKLGEHCRKGKPAHQLWDGIAPEMIDSDRMFSPDFHIGTSFVFSISHENP